MNSMTKSSIAPSLNGQPPASLATIDSLRVDLLDGSRLRPELEQKEKPSNGSEELLNGDDTLVDITCNVAEETGAKAKSEEVSKATDVRPASAGIETEIKPLTDINVTLETIKPGN